MLSPYNIMPYVEEENGKLNNFPIEVKPVLAEPPSLAQQKVFILIGLMGLILVAGTIWIAVVVS